MVFDSDFIDAERANDLDYRMVELLADSLVSNKDDMPATKRI